MAGVRVSYPNASATDAERAAQQVKFEEELTALDAEVAANGGPYLAGEAVSVVDAMYMPMMERWAVQLPLTTGIHLRPDGDASAKYPALARWLDTMETEVPAYRDVVKGDAYSWSALVGTFQRMFDREVAAVDDTDSREDVLRRGWRRICLFALYIAPAGESILRVKPFAAEWIAGMIIVWKRPSSLRPLSCLYCSV